MEKVDELLAELEDILEQSRTVPFSSKVAVNRDEIYEIIDEIRRKLHEEIRQSRELIKDRNKILIDAQKEADELLDSTKERITRLVDSHEISQQAYEHASQIVDNAKATAKEMRIGAKEYVDEVLSLAEEKLVNMMEELRTESLNIDNFFNQKLDIIHENRQELKGFDDER